VCPNSILYAHHIHYVKVFAKQHNTWIEMSGECKPLEYYTKIHGEQNINHMIQNCWWRNSLF